MWMFFSAIVVLWMGCVIGTVLLIGWVLFDIALNANVDRPLAPFVDTNIYSRPSAMMGFGFFILIVGMLGEWAVQWAFPEFASYFPKISFSFLP